MNRFFILATLAALTTISACSTAEATDPEPGAVATVVLYSASGTDLAGIKATAKVTKDKAGKEVTAYAEFVVEPQAGDDVTFFLDDGREWRGIVFGRSIDAGDLTLRVASVPQRW